MYERCGSSGWQLLELPLKCNQNQNQCSLWHLAILRVTEILCSFRLVLQEKTGKEIPESSRIQSLEKVFSNQLALSDAKYIILRLLNRGGIVDLPLLRIILAIYQKSLEPSFREVIYFASLTASGTLLQWLLACQNFTLDSEDLFCCYKRKKWCSNKHKGHTLKNFNFLGYDLYAYCQITIFVNELIFFVMLVFWSWFDFWYLQYSKVLSQFFLAFCSILVAFHDKSIYIL